MKLIFHIGAGKTGSSSIQKTLNNAHHILLNDGVLYAGLLFENIETKMYDWQSAEKSEEFHALPKEVLEEELLNLLLTITREYGAKNIHTIIWSSESFFGRMGKVLPVLKKFEGAGNDVKIVAYLRRHDSWARSAYVQWGIKHKTNLGDIKPFKEWVQTRMPNFMVSIEEVLKVYPEDFFVRNMDEAEDVVSDFLSLFGLADKGIQNIRDNDSPKNEELFLRAVYNQKFKKQVLPVRFNTTFGNKVSCDNTPQNLLESLLPNESDLVGVLERTLLERNRINNILTEQGQKPFSNELRPAKRIEINLEKVVMALTDMVVEQSKRIDTLHRLIEQNNIDNKI